MKVVVCVLWLMLIEVSPVLVHPHRNHETQATTQRRPMSVELASGSMSLDTSRKTPTACMMTLPMKCSCVRSIAHVSITCAMAGLTSVPHLDVDSNFVVKTLNLEHNQLQSIEIGSFYGVKIERLLMSNNSMSSLNFLAFWGLEYNLQTLDLSYNFFAKVPSSPLRLLRHLRSLSLKGNKITMLHEFDFGYLTNLEILSLDNNPISAIAPRTFVGTKLSLLILNSIDLQHGLESFPSGDLILLKGLSLANNGLSFIPDDWFKNCKSLRFLSLDGNKFANLREDALLGLEDTLETLEINNNELHRIPIFTFRKLPFLKTLEISHNMISKLYPRSFNCSSKLENLDLSYNAINKISIWAFDGMDTIQMIDLRHNDLTTLDDRTLYWSDPKGREILLAGNPWLCNCLIKWIKREHKRKTDLSTMFTDGLDMLCDRPYSLAGRPVIRMQLRYFTCDNEYYYYYVVDETDVEDEDMEDNDYDYDEFSDDVLLS